ncbi:hypothetical protein [Gordonia malaquae]|uniref:hypothetical protein n=1 Tax=Gordonia malaquae TaxID=410332 RepID=UPI003017BCE8
MPTITLDDDLAGVFLDGYDDDLIGSVLQEINSGADVELICVWEYVDDCGYGGDSCLHIVKDGVPHQIAEALHLFLFEAPGDAARAGHGQPDSWYGPAAPEINLAATTACDGRGNYAVHARY